LGPEWEPRGISALGTTEKVRPGLALESFQGEKLVEESSKERSTSNCRQMGLLLAGTITVMVEAGGVVITVLVAVMILAERVKVVYIFINTHNNLVVFGHRNGVNLGWLWKWLSIFWGTITEVAGALIFWGWVAVMVNIAGDFVIVDTAIILVPVAVQLDGVEVHQDIVDSHR
jgi:hypothetical protein